VSRARRLLLYARSLAAGPPVKWGRFFFAFLLKGVMFGARYMLNEIRDALFKWRMLYCYCAPDYFWMTFYSASLKAVIETVDEIQLGDSLLLERIKGSTFFTFEFFVS
jgi:hypothetical protein